MGKSARALADSRSVSYKSPHSHYSKGGRKEKDRAIEHSKRNQWRSATYSDDIFDAPVKTTKARRQHRLPESNVGFTRLMENEREERMVQKQRERRGQTGQFLGHNTTDRSQGRLFSIGLLE